MHIFPNPIHSTPDLEMFPLLIDLLCNSVKILSELQIYIQVAIEADSWIPISFHT